MAKANIVDAKYIFLDVVGFTRGRSVEAQADIVETLNEIVGSLLHEYDLPPDKRILLPTGDGLCIALLKTDPYDLHIRFALSVLDKLHVHNINSEDESRRFELRMGINMNADNLVTDINGERNLAGAGINMAQRVMDSADGNQILVSHSVHDTLHVREKYMGSFRPYTVTTKHGESVPVHQFVKEGQRGLNTEVPRVFKKEKKQEPRLTKQVAYYLAHAIRNRPFMVENRENLDDEAVVILLYYLAKDSVAKSESTELEFPSLETYKAGSATFREQYEHYRDLDFYISLDLARYITFEGRQALSRYGNCFAEDSFGMWDFRAVSDYGKRKLKQEWPDIWEEFELDENEGEQLRISS